MYGCVYSDVLICMGAYCYVLGVYCYVLICMGVYSYVLICMGVDSYVIFMGVSIVMCLYVWACL